MISQKAARYRALRRKAKNPRTPEKLIFDFFEEAENIYSSAKDADRWHYLFDKLTKSLDEHMKIIDLGARMEVLWNGADTWSELRVTGVKIWWSTWYKATYGMPDETHIDITMMLFQGDEDEEVQDTSKIQGKEKTNKP